MKEEEVGFEEYVERMFRKIKTKSEYHKTNFKQCDGFDLGTKFRKFIDQRELHKKHQTGSIEDVRMKDFIISQGSEGSDDSYVANVNPEHRMKEFFMKNPVRRM